MRDKTQQDANDLFTLFKGFLVLEQLAHEVEIRRNDGAFPFDELIGIIHAHFGVSHQKANDDGRRTTDARNTVDQNFLVVFDGSSNERIGLVEVLEQILLLGVVSWQVTVLKLFTVIQGHVRCDIDNATDLFVG